MATLTFKLTVLRAGQHQREMRAGAVTGHTDTLLIDAKPRRIGAQPAHRGLHIVDLRRPTAFLRQTVFRAHAHEAEAGELNCVSLELTSVALHPAATVQQQHCRATRAVFGRRVDVAMQSPAATAAKHHILLDADAPWHADRHCAPLPRQST